MTGAASVAIAGIVIGSFGTLGDLLGKANPWRGFQADGFNLVVLRLQRVDSAECKPWIDAFGAEGRGSQVPLTDDGWKSAWSSWEPWTGEDIEAVSDCDDFPCDVKLNAAEADAMKKAPEAERMAKFRSLVEARSRRYLKSGERKEYEFAGDPVDPWAHLEKLGLRSQVPRPEKAQLWARKYNLDPKKMKTLHQILDLRSARSKSGTEAALWVRDAYTDHYFDGWGEWATLACDPPGASKKGVTLVHALYLEVDLLKKTDLFSRLARGKLRSAIEEKGGVYLDTAFERIRERAAAR
ncbi:MAG TPA: hypothetical protein VM598_04060 [Bdellovibrionota bacterium]|nr:hypothetical protein [Bdellovibrionota bacterium]